MFVLRGTVVTMRSSGEVLEQGAVYVGDDGLIAAVTPLDAVPAGFENADRTSAQLNCIMSAIRRASALDSRRPSTWRRPASSNSPSI